MKTVMCFGTFDLLHLGHLHYLQQAKKHGDYLIVVIARDTTKKQQKKRTVFNEKERQQLIQSLKIVDEAVLGNSDDHFKIIRERRPDVICLGYDHALAIKELQERLAQHYFFPKIVRLHAYKPKAQKSTLLKKKIWSQKEVV